MASVRPGEVLPGGVSRSAQTVTTVVPANSTIQVFQPGNSFYLVIATGPVDIRPSRGAVSTYTQGTGLVVDETNLFNSLQVSNNTPNNIVISLFVGFGGFIDNREVPFNPLVSDIVYPTAPVANVTNTISIPDRSGGPITDINGKVWLALTRVGIYVSNVDLASSYSITDAAGIIGAGLVCFPLTAMVFPVAGDYQISLPASNINAVVSEVYRAVEPTLQA